MTDKVSKASVNYRHSTSPRRCETCSMFKHGTTTQGSCSLVKGRIFVKDVCDRWEKR